MSTREQHARLELLEQNPELLSKVEGLPLEWDGMISETSEQANPATAPTQLLGSVEGFIRRFSVLPNAAYLAVAVWTIATHTAKSFDCFPYLALFSPAKRCGKTRLLEGLEQLVSNPWRGTAPTPAALYRMLAEGPTLLLDEIEMFNRKDKSESTQTLLAVLNAGHRKGSTIRDAMALSTSSGTFRFMGRRHLRSLAGCRTR